MAYNKLIEAAHKFLRKVDVDRAKSTETYNELTEALNDPRVKAYQAIDTEREYQDSRWNENTTTTKGLHSVSEWILYIESYVDEARDQVARNADPRASQIALNTLRKVASMCVACFEQHGAPERMILKQSSNPCLDVMPAGLPGMLPRLTDTEKNIGSAVDRYNSPFNNKA